jgi:hypothetical protein
MANRYVDGNAPPGGDGSVNSPWRTLAQATQGVRDGDIVIISAGVYKEPLDIKTDNTTWVASGGSVIIDNLYSPRLAFKNGRDRIVRPHLDSTPDDPWYQWRAQYHTAVTINANNVLVDGLWHDGQDYGFVIRNSPARLLGIGGLAPDGAPPYGAPQMTFSSRTAPSCAAGCVCTTRLQ